MIPAVATRKRELLFALALLLVLSFNGCASASDRVSRRDSFPLDPREELVGPFPEEIARGWEALLAGDSARAEEEFSRAGAAAPPRLAARIGLIEAWVLGGKAERAVEECGELRKAGEGTPPLLTACAEAYAARSEPLTAFRLYEQVLARTADRPGLKRRAGELKAAARDRLAAEAKARAEEKDWDSARSRIARAMELDPGMAGLRVLAGDIENTAGRGEKALRLYREALELDPKDAALQAKTAEVAFKLEEYGFAVSLFDELARRDARFRDRAGEARLAFRVANWPAPEREAARKPRLSRAEAAILVWWMVPEVREARVSSGVIASDVISRRDSRAVTKALSLGLLETDRTTHRANPDAALTISAASRLLVRLLGMLRGPAGDLECLRGASANPRSAEAIGLAASCGLLQEEKEGAGVSGPEFTRALDRGQALASAKHSK